MTWHVIRLAPNALKADKGNHFRTVVEKSLNDGGFAFFMPFENKPHIHSKTKKKIWRRHPLIPGYGFVEDVSNFESLRNCDGVGDVIKSAGRPVPIPDFEVHKVMLAEMSVNAEHERKNAAQEARERMGTRAAVVGAFPINSLVTIKEGHLLAGQSFIVNAATGKATIKGVIDGFLPVEIGAVDLQAAE
tara:strand:- start:4197 stop:4763 length:567 start_codon:yes stop_codon:yes gene_type:complete